MAELEKSPIKTIEHESSELEQRVSTATVFGLSGADGAANAAAAMREIKQWNSAGNQPSGEKAAYNEGFKLVSGESIAAGPGSANNDLDRSLFNLKSDLPTKAIGIYGTSAIGTLALAQGTQFGAGMIAKQSLYWGSAYLAGSDVVEAFSAKNSYEAARYGAAAVGDAAVAVGLITDFLPPAARYALMFTGLAARTYVHSTAKPFG